MRKILPWLRRLTAAATIALATALCWQCIDIYLVGNASANLDASGLHLTPVFTVEKVSARLQPMLPWLAGYAVLALATLAMGAGHPVAEEHISCGMEKPGELPHINRLRAVLYALALAFILLGVMNGGLYDVLVKAINICTECIGLG